MKKLPLFLLFKFSLVLAGLTFLLLAIIVMAVMKWFPTKEFSTQGIFLRSWESKTIHNEPVYNTVRYFQQPAQEVWMMNQSHHGFDAPADKLDRLAIVIKNKTAHFYQLPPGHLEWSEDLPAQKIDLKVDCRQCHSNGPRAIRPAPDFKSILSSDEKITLFFLNLRMKFYGHLENNLWMQNEILPEKKFEKLNFTTCLRCHNSGNKPWNRTQLTWQQKDTILFLVENEQMPPVGFILSQQEKEEMSGILHN